MKTAIAVLILIGGPILTGAAGGIASLDAPSFYAGLTKPSWAPPPSLFGPVWSVLYLLMGIAAFAVWRQHGWSGAAGALTLFGVHLVVNGLWSWLFFHWRLGSGASADIVVLWIMVSALLIWFFRLRPAAGWLLVPYLLWVTFAAALNFAIVRANPSLFR